MNEDAFQQRNHLANIIGLEICLISWIPQRLRIDSNLLDVCKHDR